MMQSINLCFQKVDRMRYSEQVGRQIRALIERKHLMPGDQLPSERQLCESLRRQPHRDLRGCESPGSDRPGDG